MTPEQKRQSEELFFQAVEIPPVGREEFLAGIADAEVRREVESLLSFADVRDSLIDRPLEGLTGEIWDNSFSRQIIGRKFGQYRILSLIGVGGMGEVRA
jgi:hypothetical protein